MRESTVRIDVLIRKSILAAIRLEQPEIKIRTGRTETLNDLFLDDATRTFNEVFQVCRLGESKLKYNLSLITQHSRTQSIFRETKILPSK